MEKLERIPETMRAMVLSERATLHPITTSVRFFEQSEANQALRALREGSIQGAAVLMIH